MMETWQDSLGKFWNVWEVCFACGVCFSVPKDKPMPSDGWLCHDCDKEYNPKDYQ